MFYRHLKNIDVYFEYGSGGSTYQASIRENIKTIYSVESDIQWQKKLKQIYKIWIKFYIYKYLYN